MKPEHVWVRLSAVEKALKKSPKSKVNGDFDWARALLLSGVGGAALSLQVDDEDCSLEYQGQTFTLSNDESHLYILPTNEWVDTREGMPPDDLITLTHLHEPAVVYCLEKRFQNNLIYTATGPILLALNPFQDLPELYSEATMSRYWAAGERLHDESLPPHVYTSAHVAFRSMMHALDILKNSHATTNKISIYVNQTILVSGESGAGKTVTTKHIMRYLASLSQRKAEHLKRKRAPSPGRSEDSVPGRRGLVRRLSTRSVSWKAGALIEEKILESNPILEAFGNARTIRNDNSSRFGKFIELQFKHTGSLIGASIEIYLLEKVRLVHQSSGERNFHVFYEMLAAATPQERNMFYLRDYTARDFKLTSNSNCYNRRDGVNDSQMFDKLVLAMRTLGFDPDAQMEIFGVTISILHASNLDFVAVTDDSSKVNDMNPHLDPFLELLGIDKDSFQQAICEFDIEVGNKSYTRNVNKALAEKGLEALIKSTYGAMFLYIVQSINKKIDYREQTEKIHGSKSAAFIGVLDIFGFESFPTNSFEQLCINYCNEALQQQFNLFVFKTEQELYRQEGIRWEHFDFPDNQDVLDLIDQKRTGILSLLIDQCRTPGGTDNSFYTVMHKTCSSMNRFHVSPLQKGHHQFSILHYAGPVTYCAEGFVEKNKDEIPRGASKLLQSSSKDFVQLLGKVLSSGSSPSTLTARSSGRANMRPTVGSQFKVQLDELRKRIDLTIPHYIRCIKPNQSLQSNVFDKGMIADQLRNAGVLEAIRVSRAGYSQHFSHKIFLDRYRAIDVESADSVKSLANAIAELVWTEQNPEEGDDEIPEYSMHVAGIQIGKTKVFLRQTVYDLIESFRSEQLELCSTLLQSTARGFIARQRVCRIHSRIVALQALARRFLAVKHYEKQRNSAIVIQCMYRNKAARSELAARQEERIHQQEEAMRKAAIAAEKEAALAAEQEPALQRQKAAQAVEEDEAKRALSEIAELKTELGKIKAEVQAANAAAAKSKARIATLEAENKALKQHLKSSTSMQVEYSSRRSSHYKDQPDLQGISEAMSSLMQRSKQSKQDLETLAKSLEKLR